LNDSLQAVTIEESTGAHQSNSDLAKKLVLLRQLLSTPTSIRKQQTYPIWTVVNFIEFQKKENIIHLQNNILLGSFASV
jgi:hypothetical protein